MGASWRPWPGRCAIGSGECEILSCRLACARVQRMEAGPDAGPGVALPGVRHYNGFVEATDWGSSWAGARGSGQAGLAELGLGDPAGALARVAEPRTAGWKPASDMGNRLEAGWRGAQRPGWAQYVPGTHRAHLVCLTRDRQFQRLGDAR